MIPFTIEPDRWYATIAIGGSEEGSPASSELHSPLRVNRITPLKSGNRIFMLEYFQAIASECSNSQVYRLQTLDRGQKGLIAKHIDGSERLLYITHIDESWMQKHFPNVVPTDCSASEFLERAFKSNSNELIETLENEKRMLQEENAVIKTNMHSLKDDFEEKILRFFRQIKISC